MRQISAQREHQAYRAMRGLISTLLALVMAHATTISTVAGNGQAGYAASNVPAMSTGFVAPSAVAADALGNFYVADYLGHVVRKIDSKGIISTVAGNSRAGYAGDNGPATNASLNGPFGVAADAAGNLYIADTGNNVVRKVTTNGTITTIAGDGLADYAGDNGPAIAASLTSPSDVAVDGAGNIFIADTGNRRIRKVSTVGIINTHAGDSRGGYGGDNGPATQTDIGLPRNIAVDAEGNLYISQWRGADTPGNFVRKVDTKGIITTIAGNGYNGNSGDNGPAISAAIGYPFGLSVDPSGNLYISSGSGAIRKVDGKGIVTTVAGKGSDGSSVDNGLAISASLMPSRIAIGASGNLYIVQTHIVRKVDSNGIITTVAGNGKISYSGDNGPATAANLITPCGVTTDSNGNLYISDCYANVVRKVAADGVITTVAGNGAAGYAGDGGPATLASLHGPSSLAVDADGSLYITDHENSRIRKVGRDGLISTFVGNGLRGNTGDNGPATSAEIYDISGIFIDGFGNLYISTPSVIRRVDPQGIITTVAGSGTYCCFPGDNGPATAAELSPYGVVSDSQGNLYIIDSGTEAVRKVDRQGIITTITGGRNDSDYTGDNGPAKNAHFVAMSGIAIDKHDNLYIVDSENNVIRKISTNGTVTTVVGNGSTGCTSNGSTCDAVLSYPINITIDSNDNLYIVDGNKAIVRKVPLFQISGNAASTNGRLSLTANVQVAATDIGKTGNLYAAALLPDGRVFALGGTGWVAFDGSTFQAAAMGVTLCTSAILILDGTMDVSSLKGTSIYVGYGQSLTDMLGNQNYAWVYTVP